MAVNKAEQPGYVDLQCYPLTTDWVISEETWCIVSYFDSDLLPPTSTQAEIDEWYNSLVDLNSSVGMLGNQPTNLDSEQFFLLSLFFPLSVTNQIGALKVRLLCSVK